MVKKKKRQEAHQLRIIAGKWRGQKISVIDVDGLRPTTDRVRETLFNWLALPIVNARCLDAFSGSGILSFEALSREAKSVVAIEKSREASKMILKNSVHLKADNFTLVEQDACDYLNEAVIDFDVIFLDPPFAEPSLLTKAIEAIIKRKLLKNNGYLYLEIAQKNLHLLDSFRHEFIWLKEKKAGQVCYALLRFNR